MANENTYVGSVAFKTRRVGMRKFIGFLFVAVVLGIVAPGAFAANGSHRHHQQRHHHKRHHS